MANPFQIAHGAGIFAKHLVNQVLAGEDANLVLWERASGGALSPFKTLSTGWHKVNNSNPFVNWSTAIQVDARVLTPEERVRVHSASNRGMRHLVDDKAHAEGVKGYHFLVVKSSEVLRPVITTISPSTAASGGGQFTLTVNGGNGGFFRSDSVVRWQGADLVTTYISNLQLTAIVDAPLIAAAGMRQVAVYQAPNPYGGGLSNAVDFSVGTPPLSTLLNGLLAFWKLDEASGMRIDATGNGHHLAQHNNPGSAPGLIGNAAIFDHLQQQYLDVANIGLTLTGGFTFAIWEYDFVGVAGSKGDLALYETAQFSLEVGDPNEAVFTYYGDGTDYIALASGFLLAGQWNLIVVWREVDGGEVGLAVNDHPVIITTPLLQPIIPADAHGLTLSKWVNFPGGHGRGRLDGAGLWNRALTAAERSELYNGGVGNDYPF